MTAWRPAPIRQEETRREKDEKEEGPEETAVSAAAVIELPGEANAKPRGFAGTIKQLFRDAMKTLTGRAPVPEPKPRKKRTTDDTGGAFFRAARKFVGHIRRRPVIQTLGLHEPELWQWNNADVMYQASEEFHCAETNHLSPHL
jgi:hypothetical protein